MNLLIKHSVKSITRRQADAAEHLVLVLPATRRRVRWPKFPYALVLRERLSRLPEPACGSEPLVTDLPNSRGTRVSLAGVREDISSFDLLSLARQLAEPHLTLRARRIVLCVPGLSQQLAGRVVEALASALLAGAYPMPSYKSKPRRPARLRSLHVHDLETMPDTTRILACADGNNLARELTALPPNELTPRLYRKRIADLAKNYGWKMTFLDSRALKRRGAGAFLAVAQGSSDDDAGIVRLRYRPPGRARRPGLALVGKGICFDTGGMNLKPAKHMHGMHEDMQGSAIALGALAALTRLSAEFPVDCWLALAQNHIGPRAYKQNDVVTAVNGTTIEIVHTDAEGRMVLADTLALANHEKPALIIDYATLTGACVYALSTRYSGAFTNRTAFLTPIMEAGRDSGERVWPFPTDSDFDTDLKSGIADVRQCTLDGEADHILAARFLARFVEQDTPWIHIDLAAGNHKGGLAHVPTDITGFGVRYTLDLLLDKLPHLPAGTCPLPG